MTKVLNAHNVCIRWISNNMSIWTYGRVRRHTWKCFAIAHRAFHDIIWKWLTRLHLLAEKVLAEPTTCQWQIWSVIVERYIRVWPCTWWVSWICTRCLYGMLFGVKIYGQRFFTNTYCAGQQQQDWSLYSSERIAVSPWYRWSGISLCPPRPWCPLHTRSRWVRLHHRSYWQVHSNRYALGVETPAVGTA